MITFYRTKKCPGCQSIQAVLENLSLAHKVVIISDKNKLPHGLPPNTKFPALVDNGEIVQGNRNIVTHMEKLEGFKKEWDKFQSDACYCDE